MVGEEIRFEEDQEAQVLAEKAKADHNMQVQQLRAMLEEKVFRDFVWRVLSRCGIYDGGFALDLATLGFKAGKREVGLRILAEIMEAEPSAYVIMQQENTNAG